jgi:hypothetical protein
LPTNDLREIRRQGVEKDTEKERNRLMGLHEAAIAGLKAGSDLRAQREYERGVMDGSAIARADLHATIDAASCSPVLIRPADHRAGDNWQNPEKHP